MVSIFSCADWPFLYFFGKYLFKSYAHLIGLFLMKCKSYLYILDQLLYQICVLQIFFPSLLYVFSVS